MEKKKKVHLLQDRTGMLFPGKEWVYSTPEEQGFDSGPLREIDSMMKRAEANGVLIRNGYLVAEWNYGGYQDQTIPYDVYW